MMVISPIRIPNLVLDFITSNFFVLPHPLSLSLPFYIGNYVELIETKPPIRLERLRQANIPNAYQPPVDLQALGSGLRSMSRRRDSQISIRSRHRMSRANSTLNTHDIAVVNSNCNINDKNQTSFSKLNGSMIKQRLKQIKLPKLPFNFGRNTKLPCEQSRNDDVIVSKISNNTTKQNRDEGNSETIDCRGFCSPKLKSKRNSKYHLRNNHGVDDDELDEENEETDNSDCIDDETDIDLSDDDLVSEDNQSKNKISILYQHPKFPHLRGSTRYSLNESSLSTAVHYKKYSHSESDLFKKIPVLSASSILLSSSSSFNDSSDNRNRKQHLGMFHKSRKKLMRESYQAMNKSKCSLEFSSFPNIENNPSIIVENVST
ncbi:Phosphatidylinositide phosphatase SAC2 [Schistosoma japonicum]|nr:Phosphatidylinositide phosphatase SAC2 [Schistosoma japonicum]